MNYSKIKLDLKIESTSPDDLLLPENLDSLKYKAFNFLEYLDLDGALLFADILEKKLTLVSIRNNEQKYIYDILSYWVLRLRIFSYGSLNSKEKGALIKKFLVKMFKLGLDVKKPIVKFLDIFDSLDIILQEIADLLSDLNNSQEYLGDVKKFPASSFKPIVLEWIGQYQILINQMSKGKKVEPGAFHIVKFMDTNAYVKYLSAEEKNILKEIFDLYNWLLNPISYEDNKQVQNSSTNFQNSQKFTLPEGLNETQNNLSVEQNQPVLKPVVNEKKDGIDQKLEDLKKRLGK